MFDYVVPITNYNKRDKYTQEYFDNNFYTEIYSDPMTFLDLSTNKESLISIFSKSGDYEVIRRRMSTLEDDDGCNINPKERRIELYNVLKHFLNISEIKHNDFEGKNKEIYEYEELPHGTTFCICGQRSKLFICEHKSTGMLFYMGSNCIKLFQPSFEPEGNKGVCSICAVNLRMKSNKKKGINMNYDGNCKNICNLCNPIPKLITKNFLNIWKTYTKTEMEKERIIKLKLEEEHHIKILRMLRRQTNEMLNKIC